MRYFKCIDGEGWKSYKTGIIYPSDYLKVLVHAQGVFKQDFEEVSRIEYLKQEGWYIKGSPEFGKWLNANSHKVSRNMCEGIFPRIYYHFYKIKEGKYQLLASDSPQQGEEITIEDLNEIFNLEEDRQMEIFCVKVNPTTSEVLQKLAFENGYKWLAGGKKVSHINEPYIHFWKDNTICYSKRDDGEKVFSLEEAISFIVENKYKKGEWVICNSGDLVCLTKDADHLKDVNGFGISVNEWLDKQSWVQTIQRKATNQEIQNALIKEAKRRNLDINTKIKCISGYITKRIVTNNDFSYNLKSDQLLLDGFVIYEKGKWAKPVDDIPKEIFGYEVTKLDDERYKFGCYAHVYSRDELYRILLSLKNIPGEISVKDLRSNLGKFIS